MSVNGNFNQVLSARRHVAQTRSLADVTRRELGLWALFDLLVVFWVMTLLSSI